MVKLFIGVIIAAFVMIVGFMVIDPELSTNIVGSEIQTSEAGKNTAKYSIEGEVYKPGTYSLEGEVTMADLIEAAGGTQSTSDTRCYFEEAVLTGGMTYYIGSLYDVSDICNSNEIQKVNINNDDASALTTVTGITSAIANSIVSWRAENTQFNTIEDLLDVYGIGTATYRKVRNFVILHE